MQPGAAMQEVTSHAAWSSHAGGDQPCSREQPCLAIRALLDGRQGCMKGRGVITAACCSFMNDRAGVWSEDWLAASKLSTSCTTCMPCCVHDIPCPCQKHIHAIPRSVPP